VFVGIAFFGAFADLLSKYLVFAWLGMPDGQGTTYWIWKDYFGFQTLVNQGALFGIAAGWGWLFVALSGLALLGIPVWLFYGRAAEDRLLTISLAGVMGGIIGNLYDRLGLWHGAVIEDEFRNGVRDWILFRYQEYAWPNFNIADSLLVCGAILLAWHAFTHRDADETKSAAEDTPKGK